MLSLQVSLSDQTLLRPLGGSRFLIGSDPRCDVRIQAEAVEPVHARIEPVGTGYRIVDLGTRSGTRVNGKLIGHVHLELGDRIEIGPAVILVGDQVIRAATPKEVLDETAPMWTLPAAGARRRGKRARRGRRSILPERSMPGSRLALAALVVGLAVAIPIFLSLDRNLPESDPPWLDQALGFAWQGKDAEAGLVLAELERSWAREKPSRGLRLAEAKAEAAVAKAAFAKVDAIIEHMADRVPRKTLEERLRDLGDAKEPGVAKAARNRLARLEDLLLARSGKTGLELTPELIAQIPRQQTPEPRPDADEILGRVRELSSAGRFDAAQDLLRQAMLEGGPGADRFREEQVRLQSEAKARIDRVFGEAKRLEKSGNRAAALALLDSEKVHFPEVGPLALLSYEALRLGRELSPSAAPMKALPSGAPLADNAAVGPNELLATALQREKERRFPEARSFYLAALAKVKDQDHALAKDLETWANEAEYMERTWQALAAAATAEPERFRKILSGGAVVWDSASVDALLEHLPRAAAPASDWLGLAVLAFRGKDRERGEKVLRLAFQKDPRLSESIQDILARARGEEVPTGGYVLDAERWVASTVRDDRLRAEQLGRKLADVLKVHDEAGRSSAYDKLLLETSTRAEPVVMALKASKARLVESLRKSTSFSDGLGKVAALRAELDDRRKAAIALIFDENRYLYPFKPPEVSSDKAAAYTVVQQDVDRLIAAVREVWDDTKTTLRVPQSIRAGVRDISWLNARLFELGESSRELEKDVPWVATLPDDDVITIRSFCADAEELERLVSYRQIQDFNAKASERLTAAERDVLVLTNEYRLMMGRRPVAVNLKILAAARGHCEEMEKLGYFSHFSPTPGRRTPFDRMKLAGYTGGIGENLALHGSASGAHQAWLHSSGHHRNILMDRCQEFACANRGSYWCQNFGIGKEDRADPLFGPNGPQKPGRPPHRRR